MQTQVHTRSEPATTNNLPLFEEVNGFANHMQRHNTLVQQIRSTVDSLRENQETTMNDYSNRNTYCYAALFFLFILIYMCISAPKHPSKAKIGLITVEAAVVFIFGLLSCCSDTALAESSSRRNRAYDSIRRELNTLEQQNTTFFAQALSVAERSYTPLRERKQVDLLIDVESSDTELLECNGINGTAQAPSSTI